MSTVTMTNFRCRKCNRRCVNRPDDYPEGLCYWCAMLERAKGRGWKYVDDRSCPRLLVGKRCRNYANANSWGSCWCRTYANDHGYRWKDCEGNKFVLWEPY